MVEDVDADKLSENNYNEGLDELKAEGDIPFVMNPRSNYVGKKSAFLDSPRTIDQMNMGVPNFWTF